MPRAYSEPAVANDEPTKEVRFWIQSSRGTDEEEVVRVPKRWQEPDIRAELEEWCSQFGCWDSSENTMSYGYKPVRRKRTKKH